MPYLQAKLTFETKTDDSGLKDGSATVPVRHYLMSLETKSVGGVGKKDSKIYK